MTWFIISRSAWCAPSDATFDDSSSRISPDAEQIAGQTAASENWSGFITRRFKVVESALDGQMLIPISPDVATCDGCLRELFNPRDRRYRYPFINCTNCGPRLTIIEEVPDDRAKPTVREFVMCSESRAECEDPLDRRFHAEATACAKCGPRVYLTKMGMTNSQALRERR
jgi:hydrogenase maturation factor HypF (carbamoyltransferase family)